MKCRSGAGSDWVIDLDLGAFFDSIDHDLMLKAVSKHTDVAWVLLYVKRWLEAPLQHENGTWLHEIGEPVGVRHLAGVGESVPPLCVRPPDG